MELLQPLFTVFWSFFEIFLYCEFGENVTSRFDDVYKAICESDWHSFPIEIQKNLPIIMVAAQHHVHINGFGNVSFSRQTFKKVAFFNLNFFSINLNNFICNL